MFPDWKDRERWLFVTPHDDDPVIAGGLLLAQARAAGVEVRIRIATDGRMGYTPSVSSGEIVRRRQEESISAFGKLGIDDVDWWGYPDSRLHIFAGRFSVPTDDTADESIHTYLGYTGLQNSIVAELRSYRPTRLFLMSANDYHPDHKIVHQEAMISLFHGQSDIWPELGPPIDARPWVHELAVYRPFLSPPDIRIQSDRETFQTKLDAIADFSSQTQIVTLVEAIRNAGAVEYVRSYRFDTYDPSIYNGLFDGDE